MNGKRTAPFDVSPDVSAERQVIDIYLQPGELYFGDADTRLSTLLGSCVAITLWHPRRRIGGMCHFMLPRRNGPRHGQDLDGKYGDEAMLLFLEEIRRHHTRAGDYQVKVFGGGNMFPGRVAGHTGHIGRRNGEFALECLAASGFAVEKSHLAGSGHRQIVFEVGSGDVWLRHADLALE